MDELLIKSSVWDGICSWKNVVAFCAALQYCLSSTYLTRTIQSKPEGYMCPLVISPSSIAKVCMDPLHVGLSDDSYFMMVTRWINFILHILTSSTNYQRVSIVLTGNCHVYGFQLVLRVTHGPRTEPERFPYGMESNQSSVPCVACTMPEWASHGAPVESCDLFEKKKCAAVLNHGPGLVGWCDHENTQV